MLLNQVESMRKGSMKGGKRGIELQDYRDMAKPQRGGAWKLDREASRRLRGGFAGASRGLRGDFAKTLHRFGPETHSALPVVFP